MSELGSLQMQWIQGRLISYGFECKRCKGLVQEAEIGKLQAVDFEVD